MRKPGEKAAIRDSEEEVLGTLPLADREGFLRSLTALYERYRAREKL